MREWTSRSERETEQLGEQLAKTLRAGDVVAFRGDLGAGKTAFTRGLAAGLGVTDAVSSPTFAVANLYRGGRLKLAHFDMYRITGAEALEGTGYYDFIADGETVYAIEWSENIAEALPDGVLLITIERMGERERLIRMEGGRA